jgi:aspartate kinase
MIVMKFGGASLSSGPNILNICKLVKKYAKNNKVILIASAMKDVTDKLYELTDYVIKKNVKKALKIILDLSNKHITTLKSINPNPEAVKTEIEIIKLINLLEYFIKNTAIKGLTDARVDYIVSFGERLSCRIVAEALEQKGILAMPIDASLIMATNANFGNALPLYGKSQSHIQKILIPLIKNGIIPVVTGYIGFTHDGCTTTLGRGGSDLSATFLANFLNAKAVYLWKDVEGHKCKNNKIPIIQKS